MSCCVPRFLALAPRVLGSLYFLAFRYSLIGTVTYDGGWHNDQKQGNGTMTYANGNYYSGGWSGNLRNGMGTMEWVVTRERYVGEWRDGLQHGSGEHTWLRQQDTTSPFQQRERYVGEWRNGQRHGRGTFWFANGSRYEGMWEKNLKHGLGTFFFEDGTVYTGPFVRDRLSDGVVQPVPDMFGHLDLENYLGALGITRAAVGASAIQHLLVRYNAELKQIYRSYACQGSDPSDAFVMTLAQFRAFASDTRLISPTLPAAQIDRLVASASPGTAKATPPLSLSAFQLKRLLRTRPAGDRCVENVATDVGVHDAGRTLLFREFVQGIVAIVAIASPIVQNSAANSLPRKMQVLIEDVILPSLLKSDKASRAHTISHMVRPFEMANTTSRAEVVIEAASEALAPFKEALRNLYHYYTQVNLPESIPELA